MNRIKIVQSLEGRFEESVIAYLFLVNILPICIIPMIWIETKKVAQVLNDWTDFEVKFVELLNNGKNLSIFETFYTQILYYKISNRPLAFSLKKKCLLIAIFLPVFTSISVIVIHLTMGEFKILQVCIYSNQTHYLIQFHDYFN